MITPIGRIRASMGKVDVMGEVVGYKTLHTFTRKRSRTQMQMQMQKDATTGGGEGHVASMVVRDGTGDVEVVAWDAAAEMMEECVAHALGTRQGPVYVSITQATVSSPTPPKKGVETTLYPLRLVLSDPTSQPMLQVGGGDVMAGTSTPTLNYILPMTQPPTQLLTSLARANALCVVGGVYPSSGSHAGAPGMCLALYDPSLGDTRVVRTGSGYVPGPEVGEGDVVALHRVGEDNVAGMGASIFPLADLVAAARSSFVAIPEDVEALLAALDAGLDAAQRVAADGAARASLASHDTIRSMLRDPVGTHPLLEEVGSISDLADSGFVLSREAPVGVLRNVYMVDVELPISQSDRSTAVYPACPVCSRSVKKTGRCKFNHVFDAPVLTWRVRIRFIDGTGSTTPCLAFGQVVDDVVAPMLDPETYVGGGVAEDVVVSVLHGSVLWRMVDVAFEVRGREGGVGLLAIVFS